MAKYFDRFPLVNYENNVCKNIITKVDFTPDIASKPEIFFDFEATEELNRPDTLSNNYYKSPYYDWLVFISNNIIDPYYDYYLSQYDFEQYIIKKYGSLGAAQSKVLFYRNDWASDDSVISEAVYNNLIGQIKKYYSPIVNNTNQIIGYNRVKQDWILSTNKIIELTLTSVTSYSVGDILHQNSSKATIIRIDSTNNIITVQHCVGAFTVSGNVTGVNTISQPISDLEASFWSSVSAYDYEQEQNNSKRLMKLAKSAYLSDIDRLLQQKLQ